MNLPQGIDSQFRFILVAARRARQLQGGSRPLVQTQSKKPTRVAQQEVEAGLVPFEISPPTRNNGESKKPAR
jgi:DNA-directed RNA polymerase subunit omega